MPPASACFQFRKIWPGHSHERFLAHCFLLRSYTGGWLFLCNRPFIEKLFAGDLCLIL